jgi:hypothetical protein
MRLKLAVEGNLVKAMKAEEDRIARAVTAAVDTVAEDVKQDYRSQVARAGLGNKLVRTIRKKRYPNEPSIGAAAIVYSKAEKIIAPLQSGALIKSAHGFFLAIPTDAAPKKGDGGKRITPSNFPEHVYGKLRFVYRPGKNALLVVDGLRQKRGKRGGFARASASAQRSGTGLTTVAMFTLVAQVRMPKKLAFGRTQDKARRRLPRQIRHNLETME